MSEEAREDVKWFRWWHDGTTDPKLLRLSFQHRWLWIAILTLASESPIRGSLYVTPYMPCTLEDVARKAGLSPAVTKAGIDLMMRKEFGMLELDENGAWRVVNWHKRQFVSDSSTERVKRYREKRRNVAETLQERCGNVSETAPDNRLQITDINTPLNIPPKRGKKEYPLDFEEFWSVYPRKVNKKGAFAKWRATLRKDDAPTKQQLIECAKRYAAECKRKGTEQQYILHAATFLGPQERWRDYMEEAPEPHSQAAPEYLPYSSGADILAIIDERQRKAGGAH